jgi:phenylacetate-CoA ligase
MIKLRGTNVFPEAIGSIIGLNKLCNGEFICIVEHHGANQEEKMTVEFEVLDDKLDKRDIERQMANQLKESLGVKIQTIAKNLGDLDSLTGLSSQSKIRRLIDKRN